MDGNTDQKGKNLIPHASDGGDSRPVKNFGKWIEEKGLVIVLATLCVVAVVLAGVIIVNLSRNGNETSTAVDEASDEYDDDWDDSEGIIEDEDEDNAEEMADEIARYDELLSDVNSDEAKAVLYEERAEYLMDNDMTGSYKNQAITDAVAADQVLQSIDSAALVCNVASSYDDQSLLDEYMVIFRQRQEAAGINVNSRGQG